MKRSNFFETRDELPEFLIQDDYRKIKRAALGFEIDKNFMHNRYLNPIFFKKQFERETA